MVSEAAVLELQDQVHTLEDRLARMARGQHLLATARETLDEIAQLEDDWDSYGGLRPTGAAVSAAHVLLGLLWERLEYLVDAQTAPWATAPLANGGVQFEWRDADRAIEVEIDPRGALNYLIERSEQTVQRSDPRTGASMIEVLQSILSVLGPSD